MTPLRSPIEYRPQGSSNSSVTWKAVAYGSFALCLALAGWLWFGGGAAWGQQSARIDKLEQARLSDQKDNEDFRQQVIDRLARIETKLDEKVSK